MSYYTTQQLLDSGLSKYLIAQKIDAGELIRIRRGLYVDKDTPPTGYFSALAAGLNDAVFTGSAALSAWGLYEAQLPALVRSPHVSSTTPALKIIRSRPIPTVTIHNVRIAHPLQAVADALTHEALSHHNAEAILAKAYKGLQGRDAFERDYQSLRCPSKALLRALAETAPVGTSSQWERQVIHRLRGRGLNPQPNVKLGSYYWDLYFKKSRTVVDLDSLYFHAPGTNHDTFLIGLWKHNQAVELGWSPLHFSDECTQYHMGYVLDMIERVVKNSGTALLTPAWRFHEGVTLQAHER